MAWVATAIIGSAVVSSIAQGVSADKAAGAQVDATNAGIRQQQEQAAQARADFRPFRQSGVNALSRLNYLLGLDDGTEKAPTREQFTRATPGRGIAYLQPQAGVSFQRNPDYVPPGTEFDQAGYDAAMAAFEQNRAGNQTGGEFGSLMDDFTGEDLESEPGYQFGLKTGQDAVNQSAIARGNYLSGNTLKALSRYSQDYAGTKYDNAFARDSSNKNRKFNYLSGVTNVGAGANAGTVNSGSQAANAISDLYGQAGNAQAAGYIAQGQGITNAANTAANAYMFQNYLNRVPQSSTGNVRTRYPDSPYI